MPSMPSQYYSRHDPAKNYEEHLFIAGRALQSAELNEIQKNSASRLRGIADALFQDGGIVRDAAVVVNPTTGVVQCQSGAIYIRGAVRGVIPATLSVSITGIAIVGVRLINTVITETEDPDLRDPATGTRNYDEPGAERLMTTPTWSTSESGDGEFFPIYSITDGILDAKEAPPNLNSVTQALARYDRESAGGSYVVSGLTVTVLADTGGNQVYSLAEGIAHVYGYSINFATARRVNLAAAADLKVISNEPHLSANATAQRVDFDRTPGTLITAVSITAEKTVTLTHGVFTGAQDPLPDTSVLAILEVKQGAATYVADTDYQLSAGKVDWSLSGAEPAPGSTYTVKYQYITLVTPTDVDDDGFTVAGAVVGTLILASYSQKLPRIDRLCINTSGSPVWLIGVASEFNPQFPSVPEDLLVIAAVYQTWTSTRRVVNDGVRVVPMPQLAAIDGRLDWLAQLIAQNQLESSIHTREGGTKLGLFTDPFLDDSQRDAGTAQTAAIVNGELILPISATVHQFASDITSPTSLAYTGVVTLDQPLRTGSMNINPYMAFSLVPALMTLTPAVDRWTEVVNTWASPATERFSTFSSLGWLTRIITSTRQALLGTSTAPITNLRQITVNYSIAGFGPGEVLASLSFDGVSLSTGSAVANGSGALSGSFTIPANVPSGSKLVVATGAGGSMGRAIFVGQGFMEIRTFQTITSITTDRFDPLAQTFSLGGNTQVAAIDLWFSAVPTTRTRVQIRATATGLPTQTVLAEAIIEPSGIAAVGSVTRVSFPAPVTVLAGSEYAIVVLCNDATGALSVAELGKFDTSAQRWITSQAYNVGVMLSSSNASTWTAHQDRDITFRIIGAQFTETSRAVSLGNVAVTGATDLLLMSYAERPDSTTSVDYALSFPDGSVLTVDDGQPVQLAAPVTGNIGVVATLRGSTSFSPVLFPGSQLISGIVGSTGTYVSRAVPAGSSVRVKTIFEAIIPSGATVTVEYKGIDTGDAWTALPSAGTRNVDDGFVEFIHQASSINELAVQIRLTLAGTTAARPRVRDLRVIVL